MAKQRTVGKRLRLPLCLLLFLIVITSFTIRKSRAGDFIRSNRINIVVENGDSLWSIAKKIAPDHDANEVIWYLMHLNGKENKIVYEGEFLIFDYTAIN
ncbi:MAG: hypothetical protein PHD88_03440 [Firmicutes bacterium]|nr:hypothetical protein [Bacillota bacterium]MDD4263617.1 hypothetical protein [Bacillota bacterium]MDD4693445.1 hypothetical protein [Bacillota bacterium]